MKAGAFPRAKSVARRLFFLIVLAIAMHTLMSRSCGAAENAGSGFEIKGYNVTGNTIFPGDKLQKAVAPFTGPGRTAADVEKARDAIEKIYHDAGYPAVMVNIPEQTLKNGIVRLQVIESRIGRVEVEGNRYFTREAVMRDLPSLQPGRIIYQPWITRDLGRVNRDQDIKIEPVLSPGSVLGAVNVELKVKDQLPLHGYLELNDRNSPNTKPLRVNAMVRYDNLWQRGHSAAFQFQTAPQDMREVGVLGGSYSMPSPFNKDHELVFYGIWSNSDVGFGEGFTVVGKGYDIGMRYAIPLPSYRLYAHSVSLGIDYKHFNEAVGFIVNGTGTRTPITYLPLSLSYSAWLPDKGGNTQFSAGVNLSLRGVGSNEDEFALKRYQGMANYLYATAGIQRTQRLPYGMGLFVKVDGQLTDQPLIDNEQYVAGGMENVRGYREDEVAGDDAVHGTIEVSFPDPLGNSGIGKRVRSSPFLFYDVADLGTIEPLAGQDRSTKIEGAGAGMRGSITKSVQYEFDWAVALDPTAQIRRNSQRFYFSVKAVM